MNTYLLCRVIFATGKLDQMCWRELCYLYIGDFVCDISQFLCTVHQHGYHHAASTHKIVGPLLTAGTGILESKFAVSTGLRD